MNHSNTASKVLAHAALAVGLFGAVVPPALAASFEVAVSPARYELSAKPGERVGQTITIYNVGVQSSNLAFRTMDWSLSEQGELKFHDDLQEGSCRPWVQLERRTRQIKGSSNVPYRFQINVPPDAPTAECRFMIAVEGVEPAHAALLNSGAASLSLPVAGRINVTVYLAVNGARPKLELLRVGASSVQANRLPSVTVRNGGSAHGRLDGVVSAVDAKGQHFEMVPDNAPVLAGQTRTLTLTQKTADGAKPLVLNYPLTIKGLLEWDDGAFQVDASIP